MSAITLGIAGAAGRMGKALVRLAAADPRWKLTAALAEPGDPALGKDAGELAGVERLDLLVTKQPTSPPQVLIEFTSPAGCATWADWCAANGVRLVSGTTGLDAAARAALDRAAARVAVLWAANMSVGVNLLLALAAQAARQLAEWDVEIVEAHHNQKADAPSGTAAAILEAVCAARGQRVDEVAVYGREGRPGPRKRGEIGVHALRLGDVTGEHEVHLATPAESIVLRHRATSRDVFAAGALRAARWLADRPPKRYEIRDVFA